MLNSHNKTCIQQINKHLYLTQTGCPKIAFLIDCLSNSTIKTPYTLKVVMAINFDKTFTMNNNYFCDVLLLEISIVNFAWNYSFNT